jgi:hypothetical protein
LRTPKKHKKVTYRTDRYVKYSDFVRSAITRKVHLFFLQNIPPTKCGAGNGNNDDKLPHFKRTTFYALMKKIGFNYEKIKKALLVERCDIIIWRHSYLRKIKRFWVKTFTWMSRWADGS